MGVKILFFSRGTLGQNSMFPEKGGQNSIFFPSALKKGGQNRGAYQPTSLNLKGCPPRGFEEISFRGFPGKLKSVGRTAAAETDQKQQVQCCS